MVKIFVYGTLKPGEAAHHRYCEPYLVRAQTAWVRGELFHLPQGYPALTDGDRWIQGALLTLQGEQALAHMDAFEDYDPARPDANNLYVRRSRPIVSAERQLLATAWVYLMDAHRVVELGGVVVPTGCWSRRQWPSLQLDVTPASESSAPGGNSS